MKRAFRPCRSFCAAAVGLAAPFSAPGGFAAVVAPLAVACLAPSTVAQTPGWHFIQPAATIGSTNYATVRDVSYDGRVAVGFGRAGFLWTETAGRVDYWATPGGPIQLNEARAVSPDGTAIAGGLNALGAVAHRWVGPGTYQELPLLPTYVSAGGLGISNGGGVVVGRAYNSDSSTSNRGQAFRWTPTGGMQGLGYAQGGDGFDSAATGVSADGRLIVGWSEAASTGATKAFTWTESGGMRTLPDFSPQSRSGSSAYAVNAAGTLIVGSSSYSDGVPNAAMWAGTTLVDLGRAPSSSGGTATDLSEDGSVVLCQMSAGFTDRPAVWTQATGVVWFEDYLALNGVSIPAGLRITEVNAISGDGRTFGGSARFNGVLPDYGFVLTIPAPGGMLLMAGAVATARRRRR